MAESQAYQAKQFNLSGLHGISDQTLEMHFKLYEGYVKETNRLTEKIWDFLKDGHVDQEEMPAYSELTRRLGFEYNGMVLHEYYFGNMTKAGSRDSGKESHFYKAAEAGFGSCRTTDRRSVRRWRERRSDGWIYIGGNDGRA
jgi:Fe-Mn family superoxide dismutase